MVFAIQLEKFYHDKTTPTHLLRFNTLTTSSRQSNSESSIWTLQKPNQ